MRSPRTRRTERWNSAAWSTECCAPVPSFRGSAPPTIRWHRCPPGANTIGVGNSSASGISPRLSRASARPPPNKNALRPLTSSWRRPFCGLTARVVWVTFDRSRAAPWRCTSCCRGRTHYKPRAILRSPLKTTAACAAFNSLKLIDSVSVVAWTGVADCNAFDRTVVVSSATPTGHAFRASYEAAARAYRRAAEVGPAVDSPAFQGWILGRLSHVLFSAPNETRAGYGADSTAYYSLPHLDRDTLAFWPMTVADLSAGRFAAPRGTVLAAVSRNRTLMRHVAEEWVRRSPAD